MTRPDPTDLICRARRRELNSEERRQLQDLVQRSGEMRLLSVMLSEFERESHVRPGDDVLLARIGERALGVTAKAPPRSGRRARLTILLAAALMLLGSAAWAWRTVFVASRSDAVPTPVPSAPALRFTEHTARRAPVRSPQGDSPLAVVPPQAPRLAPREDVRATEGPSPRPSEARSALVAPQRAPFNAAGELFARANSLRRQGRTSEAAALYELVVGDYPASREAPPARLALGKILRARAPARAFTHFRELSRRSSALRAEALWGMAESARSMGNPSLEAQALADLVREFPDSPYADAARTRTSHGAQ